MEEWRGDMRSVMVFGSFDSLHEGHRSLFRQAKRHGDWLIAVTARDANIRRIKGHEPRVHEEERLATLSAEPLVDKALLGHESDFLRIIVQERPDVIILGYDQTTFSEEKLRELLQKRGLNPEIMRAVAFHPEKYKSSLTSSAR